MLRRFGQIRFYRVAINKGNLQLDSLDSYS